MLSVIDVKLHFQQYFSYTMAIIFAPSNLLGQICWLFVEDAGISEENPAFTRYSLSKLCTRRRPSIFN